MLARFAAVGGMRPRPTYVATGTRTGGSGGTVVISRPSGLQVGDLMIAVLCVTSSAGTPTWTELTGWTEVLDSSGTRPTFAMQWKVADSADVAAADFTFTATAGGTSNAAAILAYRGAAFDAVGTETRSASASVTATAITVGPDNSVLLAAFASGTAALTVTTAPSGMTQRSNQTSPGMLTIYSQDVGAGGSGTKSITYSGGSATTGVLFSIKPA